MTGMGMKRKQEEDETRLNTITSARSPKNIKKLCFKWRASHHIVISCCAILRRALAAAKKRLLKKKKKQVFFTASCAKLVLSDVERHKNSAARDACGAYHGWQANSCT